jgi:hypothetical protein
MGRCCVAEFEMPDLVEDDVLTVQWAGVAGAADVAGGDQRAA